MSPAESADAPLSTAALLALRERAEARRRLVTEAIADKGPAEVERLVQELQVHQIELEMQYEELLLAQTEAETVRAQYVDLYDFAPLGYCTLDAHGLILLLNLAAARLLGTVRQRLMGRRFPLFVARPDREKFVAFLGRVLATDHRQTCELEMLDDNGTPFFAQLEGVAVVVSENQPPQCRLAIIDTTARHEASRALAASEARFRQLFEQSSDASLLVQDNRVVDCNPAALHLVGAQHKDQVVGRPPWEHATDQHPSGRPSADQYALAVVEAQHTGSRRGEFTLRRVSGEVLWVEAVITPITVGTQALVHIVWRDVTATKRAQEQLQASEARLNLALEASGTGVFTWDFATNEVQWDEAAQAAFGHPYRPDKVSMAVLLSRLHPHDAARVDAATHAAIASGEPLEIEYRVLWPDGTLRHVSSAGRVATDAAGRRLGFAGVVRDTTALRRAEEELRYQNLLTERMLEAMPVMLARIDAQGYYLEAVGQGLSALGLSKDALVGLNALELFPAAPEKLSQLLAGERVEFDNEVDYQGRRHHFHSYCYFDQERQQTMLLAIDVTPLAEQRRQLRAEKEFSESLLDNSVDGIMAFDQAGHFRAWNRVLQQHTGRPAAQVLGRPMLEVFPEWRGSPEEHAIRQMLHGKRLMRYNLPFHPRSGHYESYLVPLLSPEGEGRGGLVLVRDVTERVQLAEETTRLKLRQQQEVLSAILSTQEEERKRIAEALHNGVGQLLYAAKLNLETRNAPSEAARTTALSLLEDAIRATRTISFELTPGILEDFGLCIALEELTKRIPRQNLNIHLNLRGLDRPRPRLLEIAVYRVVQELLNNIIKHARASEAFIHVIHEADSLHISVEDNGIGIDPQRAAAHHGIGLAGIRNRLDLLGGQFSIDSRPGRGTIITIELVVK